MAAIFRVKRRHDDEPLNALVVSCKRQKIAESDDTKTTSPDPLTTVAKFAGTIKKQNDSVEHLIENCKKDEVKTNFKRHLPDIINKARKRIKQSADENRYKVINCIRSLDSSTVENLEDKVTTVFDIEDSQSIAKKDDTEKDDSYVYDLYYLQTEKDMYLDDMVSIHPYEQELVFDTYNSSYAEAECESEDSNSESNWRNDYPDSDHSENSIDERDMREAVMNMRLDDESDLSEDEDLVYTMDEADVDAYGYTYAKYKARMKKELGEEEGMYHSDQSGVYISEDSDDDEDIVA